MDFVFLIPIIISIIMIIIMIIIIIIIIKDATLQNLRTKATLRRRGVSLFHVLTVVWLKQKRIDNLVRKYKKTR